MSGARSNVMPGTLRIASQKISGGKPQSAGADPGPACYALGGTTGTYDDPLSANEEFDPALGTWQIKAPMPSPRASLGVAVVDNKHQIVVHAEAYGAPQEHELLQPMVEGTRENLATIGTPSVFEQTKLTADSGFHTEKNMQLHMEQGIDAYVADTQFRKRDPRFAERDRYKERFKKEHAAYHGTTTVFTTRYFTMSDDARYCICPAGKRLHRNGANVIVKGKRAIKFRGNKADCRVCALRTKCLRYPDRTETRQVYFFQGRAPSLPESFTEKMKAQDIYGCGLQRAEGQVFNWFYEPTALADIPDPKDKTKMIRTAGSGTTVTKSGPWMT